MGEFIASVVVTQLVIGGMIAIGNAKILGVHVDYLKADVKKLFTITSNQTDRISELEKRR